MYAAFAQGLYATFADGGNEQTFRYFDPDFVWVTAHNGWNFRGSPYLGIDGVWNLVFINAAAHIDPTTYRFEIKEIVPFGADHVAVLGHYVGNSVKTGKLQRIEVAHLWTLKNGRMRKFQQFTDTYLMQHFHS